MGSDTHHIRDVGLGAILQQDFADVESAKPRGSVQRSDTILQTRMNRGAHAAASTTGTSDDNSGS